MYNVPSDDRNMSAYQPEFRIDLHSHTTRSDGNDTLAEFLRNAAGISMLAVAMTDHDVLPPETVDIDGQNITVPHNAASLGVMGFQAIPSLTMCTSSASVAIGNHRRCRG